MTSWAERRREAALWRDYERQQANQVPCTEPGCEAPTGVDCRNVHDGGELTQPAHWRRIKAAEEAS